MTRPSPFPSRTWPKRSSAGFGFSSTCPLILCFSQGSSVHNLGQTRSSHQPNHLLLTPDTFVRTPLPGMKNCTAIVHISPALGAAFTQYTAECEAGGELGPTSAQRFLFVLDGTLSVEAGSARDTLGPGGYAFLPQGMPHRVTSSKVSRVAVIEKPYQPLDSVAASSALIS